MSILTKEQVEEIRKYISANMQDMKPITSEPRVKILADSLSPTKKRLTTFELTFWRPILPEITRHRCFSFSVRSSRATPVDTLIAEISNSPWGPCEWGENQKGMVAEKVITQEEALTALKYIWYHAAKGNCSMAKALADAGVHKQIANRLLEPFSCTHMVLSGTEWDNFYKLRCAKDAQPEMRALALKMKEVQEESEPEELDYSAWHLPYITEEDREKYSIRELCKISAARCARVSYKLYDGSTDVEKDLELFNKLSTHGHCYSADTEVLTEEGWKFWPQVTNQDKLACVDQYSLEFLGFHNPIRLISYNYTGKMYSVNHQHCSFDVTEGHTMIGQVISRAPDRYNYKYSPFVIGEYSTKKAKKPNGLREMNIPLVPKVNTTLDPKGQLIGFYAGDGFFLSKNIMSFRLKKERKISYLRNVLKSLHFTYSEKVRKNDVHQFYIRYSENSSEVVQFLEEIKSKCHCGARNKTLGTWEYPLLAGIFDGLKNSDGGITKDNTWTYSSFSYELIQDILRYAPLAGHVAKEIIKQKDAYRIFFKKYPLARLNDSRRRKEESHVQVRDVTNLPVYCAEVVGHGLIVRRNGKQMICGNCSPLEHQATPTEPRFYLSSNFKGWNQFRQIEEFK